MVGGTNLLQVVVQFFLPNTWGLSKLLHFQKPTVRQIPGSLPKRKESPFNFQVLCSVSRRGIRLMSQKSKGRKIERADNNILRVVDADPSRCSPPLWKTLQICKDVIPVASWIAGDWQEHAKASVGKSWVQHNMGSQFTDSSDLVADQALLLCMIGRILIARFGDPAAWSCMSKSLGMSLVCRGK